MCENVEIKKEKYRMLLLINIVIGIVLAFGTSCLKKFRETVQGEIFCGFFYLLEILECIFKHTIRIYSRSAVFSIIIIILLPFVIFFIYTVLKGIIETKTKNREKLEDK